VFADEGGAQVHPHVFRSVLGHDRGIVEYQVRQTANGADVSAIGEPDDTRGIERAIAGQLRRLGVDGPLVTVSVVTELDRQQTGKMRRFVPYSAVRRSCGNTFDTLARM
jgi:hypothetical protein